LWKVSLLGLVAKLVILREFQRPKDLASNGTSLPLEARSFVGKTSSLIRMTALLT
jgi:hypothetical protein